jgi:hypothetical protein
MHNPPPAPLQERGVNKPENPRKAKRDPGYSRPAYCRLLFLFGRCRRLRLAHGAGLAAGGAFLGFTARVHLIAAFFAGKDAHGIPPDQSKSPGNAAVSPGRPRRPSRQSGPGGHIIMNNTRFRQEMFEGTASRALRLNYTGFREGWAPTGWKPVPLAKSHWPPSPLPANSPAPPLIPMGDQ